MHVRQSINNKIKRLCTSGLLDFKQSKHKELSLKANLNKKCCQTKLVKDEIVEYTVTWANGLMKKNVLVSTRCLSVKGNFIDISFY